MTDSEKCNSDKAGKITWGNTMDDLQLEGVCLSVLDKRAIRFEKGKVNDYQKCVDIVQFSL